MTRLSVSFAVETSWIAAIGSALHDAGRHLMKERGRRVLTTLARAMRAGTAFQWARTASWPSVPVADGGSTRAGYDAARTTVSGAIGIAKRRSRHCARSEWKLYRNASAMVAVATSRTGARDAGSQRPRDSVLI